MATGTAARRYAKALFQLAGEQDQVAKVQDELGALLETLAAHPSLREVLLRPLYPAAERRKVLEAVGERMQASDLLRKFVAFLIDQRRLVDLEGIRDEYVRLADQAAGMTQAIVRAASPLSEAQQARIRTALSRRVGSDVQLKIELDPSLIGGLVAKVGDLLFDGSVETQLQQLRTSLS